MCRAGTSLFFSQMSVFLVLTCLCGFPPGLLYVLLCLVAELDLQLLGLHLQILLPVCQRFTGLQHTQKGECVNVTVEPSDLLYIHLLQESLQPLHV